MLSGIKKGSSPLLDKERNQSPEHLPGPVEKKRCRKRTNSFAEQGDVNGHKKTGKNLYQKTNEKREALLRMPNEGGEINVCLSGDNAIT